jgi:hypothetical protein
VQHRWKQEKANPAISSFPKPLACPVVKKGVGGDFILWPFAPCFASREDG